MIRVLRVLEYEYEDEEAMTRDMGHWNLGANAVKDAGRTKVRSAVLMPHLSVAEWGTIKQLRRERGLDVGDDDAGN